MRSICWILRPAVWGVMLTLFCLAPAIAQPPKPELQPPPLPGAPAATPLPSVPEATPLPGAPAAPPLPSAPAATPLPSVPEATPLPNAPEATPLPGAPERPRPASPITEPESPFQPVGRADNEPGYVGLVVDTEKNGRGVIVLQVVKGGPADRAGIQHGDVLFRANGSQLQWADELGKLLRPLRPGGKVTLQIRRGDNLVEITVVLGQRPEDAKPTAHLGIEMSSVDVFRATRMGLPVKSGVWVERVTPDSAADKVGIQAGSVIIQFGEHRIASPSDLWAAVAAHQPGDVVNVQLFEGARKRSLFVRLDGSLRTDADTPRAPRAALRPDTETAESVLAKQSMIQELEQIRRQIESLEQQAKVLEQRLKQP